jgi:hypothetical protein
MSSRKVMRGRRCWVEQPQGRKQVAQLLLLKNCTSRAGQVDRTSTRLNRGRSLPEAHWPDKQDMKA